MSDEEQAQCLPFLTPLPDFFEQFGGRATVAGWAMPDLSADAQITIDGLVARPQAVSLRDLESETERHVRVLNSMMCILGWRSTAIWTGVPLRAILDSAGIDRARAQRVRFFGADGFHNNLRLADIYDSPSDLFEPLLAFRINDQPLPRALGFPVRLLLNDRYGYKNVKWLSRIEATDLDQETGQYQEAGYPDGGVIETVSTVETHRLVETVAGPTELCGFALSGHAPIASVELIVDDEPVRQATWAGPSELRELYPELADVQQFVDQARFGYPLRGVWVSWRMKLDLDPGEHRVVIRVRDADGNVAEGAALRLTVTG